MVSKFSEESFQSAWRAPGPVQSSLEGDGTEAEAERVRATGVAQGGGGGGSGGARSGGGGRPAVVHLHMVGGRLAKNQGDVASLTVQWTFWTVDS